jgi:hypothetical protein
MRAPSLRAPGLVEIFLGSILSVVLGAVVAAAILLLKPVEILKEAPKDKDLDATKIYYFEGRKEYTAGQRWRFKRDSLLQGHSVAVNEDELNTLIEDVYPKLPVESAANKPKPKAKGKEPAKKKKDDGPQPFIQTGTPNFRLTRDSLRLGVVYYVNVFGYSFQVVAQTEGSFEKPKDDEEPIYYAPSKLYLGSLPVHKLLVLKGLVFKQLVDTFEFPAEVEAAWAKLEDVSVVNRELVLTMKPEAAP